MRYILKNLKGLIIGEPFIFSIMAVCVFVSAWIMCFSYGLYQNYNVIKENTEIPADLQNIMPEIKDKKLLTKGDLVKYIAEISDDTLNQMDFIWCSVQFKKLSGDTGDYFASDCRFAIRDGKYQSSEYIRELYEESGSVISGRLFTDKEEEKGADVALVIPDSVIGRWNDATLSIKNGDNTIELFGRKFTVVGEVNIWGRYPIVPFLSLPDDYKINSVDFNFQAGATPEQFQDLKEAADRAVPEILVFPDHLPFPDKESMYLYSNIMLISAIIAVLTAINFGALYSFVVNRRKRQLAIFKICGCKSGQAVVIYLGECLLVGVPMFILGIFSFIPVMKGFLTDIFPYMKDSYSAKIYGAILGIYIVILLFIMLIMLFRLVKKNTAEVWKGGKV